MLEAKENRCCLHSQHYCLKSLDPSSGVCAYFQVTGWYFVSVDGSNFVPRSFPHPEVPD